MTSSTAAAPTATSFLRGRRSGLLFCLWATCAVLLALPAMASAKEASADLDQCANGPITALASCAGAQWQNGNLNGNQAHYFEGDSVPYRLKLADLVEDGSYVATIEWDATKAGKHALDYITSYDRTETTGAPDPLGFHANQNDVCSDVCLNRYAITRLSSAPLFRKRTCSGVSATCWRTPSMTTKSLPSPCILVNLSSMAPVCLKAAARQSG